MTESRSHMTSGHVVEHTEMLKWTGTNLAAFANFITPDLSTRFSPHPQSSSVLNIWIGTMCRPVYLAVGDYLVRNVDTGEWTIECAAFAYADFCEHKEYDPDSYNVGEEDDDDSE